MDASSRRVGEIEITPLFDGTLQFGLEKIPREDDRAAAAALLERAPPDALVMEVFAFLLRGPDGFALIDAGTGVLKGPQTGRLWGNLAKAGVAPDSIQRIYITHLHADHFGGLIDENGKAVFKNAELIVAEPEAKFWLDTPLEAMPTRAQRAVADARAAVSPYQERLRVVENDGSWRGLQAVPSPGHTPGHTSWLIVSQGHSCLAWGDVVHVPAIHSARPRTAMEYDLNPDQAGETRVRTLERAADEGFLVAGSHLKTPPFAHIRKEGAAYRIEPA
jgi:glyoxylase-like metal-dependent hydrolase (beta-lactamase superfamily II)